jgi:glycosyltransferase involved in cell wall biosynthesis
MMNKILIVTQYYPPETGAPQSRLHEMARQLVDEGILVEVLTAMPNYPEGKIFPEWRGKWMAREKIDGVDVVRVPIYPTNETSVLPRFLNYFSFVLTSVLLGVFLTRRPHVVIVESPPLFLGLSGLVLSWLRHARLVLNISDLWPESIVRLGALNSRNAIGILKCLEWFLYRRAKALTGQSKGIVSGIRKVHPDAQVTFIPNGCDCTLFRPENATADAFDEIGFKDRTIVGYAGLIGLAQGIGVYLEMARRFQKDSRIGFVLVGDGPEYEMLKSQTKSERLSNIVFLGRRPKSEMPGFVAAFDLSLVPLVSYIPGALPSKLYELMASATPIVLAADGDPKELINQANAGVVVDYDKPEEITKAIADLVRSPERRRAFGRAGRTYVLKHHDRVGITQRFKSFLKEL